MKKLQICTILKKLRKDNKASKELISEYLGVNPATYYRWERGERKIPFEAVESLSNYYGISISNMLGEGVGGSGSSMGELISVIGNNSGLIELMAQLPKDHVAFEMCKDILKGAIESSIENKNKKEA